MLISIYCRKELLWWGLRGALIYRHNNKWLRVSWILFLFNRSSCSRFSPTALICLATKSFGPDIGAICVSTCRVNFRSDHRQFGCCHDVCPTIAPELMLARQYFILQASPLVKTYDYLSSLWAGIAPSSTLKASWQQWNFQVSTAWFTCVPWLKHRVSSAIGLISKFWKWRLSTGNSMECLRGSMRLHWLTTPKEKNNILATQLFTC